MVSQMVQIQMQMAMVYAIDEDGNQLDCDDNNLEILSILEDIDCDGVINEGEDNDIDGDGVVGEEDCDDLNNTSAIIKEDMDCDGVINEEDDDIDGDGVVGERRL